MGTTDDPSGGWLPSVVFSQVPLLLGSKRPIRATHHSQPRILTPFLPFRLLLFRVEQGGKFCQLKTEMLAVANGIPGK